MQLRYREQRLSAKHRHDPHGREDDLQDCIGDLAKEDTRHGCGPRRICVPKSESERAPPGTDKWPADEYALLWVEEGVEDRDVLSSDETCFAGNSVHGHV